MNRLFLICTLVCACAINNLYSQYIVSSLADLPDSDLSDAIVSPPTLRAVIQNINKNRKPADISLAGVERKTLLIESSLPVISYPTKINGKGAELKPSSSSSATYGLWLTASGSELRNIAISGFNGSGLVWQLNNGLIETSVFCNNNGPNLSMQNASNNTIGGVLRGYFSCAFFGAKGNAGSGIAMDHCNNNTIQYCWIGVDTLMNTSPNDRYGISSQEGVGNILKGNTVSGNAWSGVNIVNVNKPSYTLITDNYIGTDNFGSFARENGENGIRIFSSQADTIRNNVISGNGGNGVYVADAQCQRIVINDNSIGVNRLGTAAIPNVSGVQLNGSGHIVRNNVISGNRYTGLSISGSDMIVTGNILGLDSKQTIAIPNRHGISAATNTGTLVVGDTSGELSNVIAGNDGNGIVVGQANVRNVIISHNVIGARRDTSMLFPNKGSGIVLAYSLNNIVVQNNVISSNLEDGITIVPNVVIFSDTTKPHLYQRPISIRVHDNCIGCASETIGAGRHGGSGVSLRNCDSIYIDRNVIIGCDSSGIDVQSDTTRMIRVTRNTIGPSTTARAQIIIHGDGIRVSAARDVVIGERGDEAKANVIQHCNGSAVVVQDSAQMVFCHANSMIANERGGITLDSLKSYFSYGYYHDYLDADHGSNGHHNTLEQYGGRINGTSVYLSGMLQGTPKTVYEFEVYAARKEPRVSSFLTQGSVFLCSFNRTTDASGTVELDTVWTDPKVAQYATLYPFVTVTVSSREGCSSFSHIRASSSGVDIQTIIDSLRTSVSADGTVVLYADISNIGKLKATDVRIRDTVHAFQLQSVSASRGTASIFDSTFVASIPELGSGESVQYVATGKALSSGVHRRRIDAQPLEPDADVTNNSDSITVVVGTTEFTEPAAVTTCHVDVLRNGQVRVVGHGGGDIQLRLYSLLGCEQMLARYQMSSEDPVTLTVESGLHALHIERNGKLIMQKLVFVPHD